MLFGMVIAASHDYEIWHGALGGTNRSPTSTNNFEKHKKLCFLSGGRN